MKPLTALGLALATVGALVALAVATLRPVGGALFICGVALVIYGLLPRSARRQRARGPYSWDDEQKGGPRELYTANPGEVQVKTRQVDHEPEFTVARPGDIPMPRHQASGGAAEYTAAENTDIPVPRDRERAAAEYTPTPREMRPDEPTPQGPQGPSFIPDLLNSENPDMPPMVPPPPRTDGRP
ncbi:MAG TPA: hypothetical protein VGR61_00225 [Candidatus Dormibacteraeota bacterium]|nr:hypothetical protein [Candidatus Dormibacteraeota bacterium]